MMTTERSVQSAFRGHSQIMLTRRHGSVVKKCRVFVNIYNVENVNVGAGWSRQAKNLST